MILKDLTKITEADLQALIDNSVLERKTLDYKKELPGSSESEKKEFLADVSSFSNASGGDLIYGIAQDNDTGFPQKVEGLDIRNADQEILRLESSIRDGIEPRIPSVAIQPIILSNTKTVLIVRVQKSWNSPHRIGFKGHHRFYTRSSNGKYELDVGELRTAFTFPEAITEKMRKFREDRISRVIANETPVPLFDNAKIMLHLMPIISFSPGQRYDIDKISSKPEMMAPQGCGSYRYNLDGFLSFSIGKFGKSYCYVQLFRNGIIEATDGSTLQPNGEELFIPCISYEKDLIESLPRFLSILKTLNVEPPILCFLSLVGVKGYSMPTGRFWQREHFSIDRDVLMLPEVMVESFDVKAEEVLRPCFDAIWNACGYAKSLNYDESGKWAPKY
jgi:hypothetical protein